MRDLEEGKGYIVCCLFRKGRWIQEDLKFASTERPDFLSSRFVRIMSKPQWIFSVGAPHGSK
jgi:hypothetical protein